jgi:hypothetical protein
MINMTEATFAESLQDPQARGGTPEAAAGRKVEINVVFTSDRGTLAALETAGRLAHELTAQINLLAPYAVPYPLPLDRPPVNVAFVERKLYKLAQTAQGALDTNVQVYLCREARQTVLQVLKPSSLVIIGGRRRWWPTPETRLAKALRTRGHYVIFTTLR